METKGEAEKMEEEKDEGVSRKTLAAVKHTIQVSCGVVGTGGCSVQFTLKSLFVPVDVNVMKPGWLEELWLLMQVWYCDTLV